MFRRLQPSGHLFCGGSGALPTSGGDGIDISRSGSFIYNSCDLIREKISAAWPPTFNMTGIAGLVDVVADPLGTVARLRLMIESFLLK